jgi:hypothetical protein
MANAKQTRKKSTLITTALVCIAIVIGITVGLSAYYLSGNTNPEIKNNNDTFVPKLVSDLQCNDNRSTSETPFLHVTGTIQNTGNATANNVTMHVYATQKGNVVALDTEINLGSIGVGDTLPIDRNFDYTGSALLVFSEPTIDWTN